MRGATIFTDTRSTSSHRTRLAAALCALLTIGACSTEYVVQAEFPRPLIEPLPVSVDLVLSDEFRNYVYKQEDVKGRSDISVDIGSAQTNLFETMAAQMFAGSELDNRHLLVTPSIEAFQYAIPRETRAEIYEIWLKYRVQVASKDGDPIADWLITGYGKTPTAFLKSPQQAIDAATSVALRDIGSQLSIGFRRQPDVVAWLAKTSEGPG